MPSAPCWAVIAALYGALTVVADLETAAIAAGLSLAFTILVWAVWPARPARTERLRLARLVRAIRLG
jgi:hypothetical protein